MLEQFYYQIDGIVFGDPREMTKQEAAERNAEFEKMKLKARWKRQSEFMFIDELKM